jgi:hypothetical protein
MAERNLGPVAFGHLTADALMSLRFDALGSTRALLKRFVSTEQWTDAEADALAEAVGPGDGWWSRPLDDEVTLEYGWRDGRFSVLLQSAALPLPASTDDPPPATFVGAVVPEATPDPRTIRFRTSPVSDGESLWFESPASAEGYWRAARLFDQFPEITNVGMGPDFVAVSLRRASDWERLRGQVLAAVADVFDVAAPPFEPQWVQDPDVSGSRRRGTASSRATRLAHAWAELGPLRPADPHDLESLLTASHGEDPFHRQVAASLLLEADPAVAAKHWKRLLDDPAPAVRRATADAMADACRERLRPLLQRALDDEDGWVRWKALRGLVELGPDPSREAIAALARDPDIRVRVEVAKFLQATEPLT